MQTLAFDQSRTADPRNDDGAWRRVCLVPFDERISLDEMDRDLPAKLDAERAGILTWAVRGCAEWQQVGLDEPDVVRIKTDEYRTDQDVVVEFLGEECETDGEGRELSSAIYACYVRWAHLRGERHPITASAFGRRLTDRGIVSSKIGGTAWRLGLRLRTSPDMENRAAGTEQDD